MESKMNLATQLRNAYRERTGEKHRIRLPNGIKFEADGANNSVKMDLGRSVTKNMQDNVAAFEAWILAIRFWLPEYTKFTITWDKNTSADNSHYQRFLYRMFYFKQLFFNGSDLELNLPDGWEKNSKFNFINTTRPNSGRYVINTPQSMAQPDAYNANSEAGLERQFMAQQNCLVVPLNIGEYFDQQLPVGIFLDQVRRNAAIFTIGHSAIDLWGFSEKSKTLHIFELKLLSNRSMGILSELLFYSMLMKDLVDGNFFYEEAAKANMPRLTPGAILDRIENIHAWFLAPTLHPLLTKDFVDNLNRHLDAKNNSKIKAMKLGWIAYKENPTLECCFK